MQCRDASAEQRGGIALVNNTVQPMDKVTQEDLARVEEAGHVALSPQHDAT